MSLVERAAKRMEDLRKAGTEVAGELAYPPSPESGDGDAALSTVERAARKLEAMQATRSGLLDVPPAKAEQGPAIGSEGGFDGAGFRRLEPKLGDAVSRASTATAGGQRRAGPARSLQKVELDLPALGLAGYLMPEQLESVLANQLRKIKRPLIQASQGKSRMPIENGNRIMVTSSVQGEGKSYLALNLALSIAMERDSTVLLIDADTTRRSLSQLARISAHAGLLDLLAGEPLEVADVLYRSNIDRLSFLGSGSSRADATELLASEAMEHLVQHLASRYADRILIFDTPPLLAAAEAAVLANHMGQVIVVVEADKTTQKVLTNALTTIESCPAVSMVLNKAPSVTERHFYAG